MKIKNTNTIFVINTICFLLCISTSFAQKKDNSDPVRKTLSSATIDGVKYYLHTVEKGQTLFAIAKFYGRELNDIVIENPEAIDGIKPGQVLRIPVEKKIYTPPPVNDSANFTFHTVAKGETFYFITKKYAISDEKLKSVNPELKDGLKIGQVLRIPIPKSKENPKQKSTSLAVIKTTPATAIPAKTEPLETAPVFSGKKKSEYNIAFFLPFHADDVDAIDPEKIAGGEAQLSNKTNIALQFYEGALLALDSLKKQKLNAKIYVYDVDERDSLNIVNILKKAELSTMDLIIGPLYGSSFMPVAKYAKEHNITIVSPFTQVNKILFNNPYVCKVTPSATLQVEQMAHFVVDTFKTQNIIVVDNANPKEAALVAAFKATANSELLKNGKTADSVKEAGVWGVQNLLNKEKVNVVVFPSNNQSIVTDFISKLNMLHDKYKIVLFGLQGWINYDNLDFEYLNNLSLHIPSNTFINYDNVSAKRFIKVYREKYNTEPEMYSYQGFDITMYFISSLYKEGTGFLKKLPDAKYQGIETNFMFSKFPSESGFENKFVYILKYQDYKLTKAN